MNTPLRKLLTAGALALGLGLGSAAQAQQVIDFDFSVSPVPQPWYLNDVHPFTFTITNNGTGTSGGTDTVHFSLPLEAAVVSAMPAGCQANASNQLIDCDLPALGPGDAIEFDFQIEGIDLYEPASGNGLDLRFSAIPTYDDDLDPNTAPISPQIFRGGPFYIIPRPVTHDLTLQVVDTQGNPVAGVNFECDPNPVPDGETTTCTLASLPSGYVIDGFTGCTQNPSNELECTSSTVSGPLDITANLRRIAAPNRAVPVPVNAPLMLVMLAGLLGFAAHRGRKARK